MEPSRTVPIRLLLLAVAVAVAAGGCRGAEEPPRDPLRFTVIFEEARGLEAGDRPDLVVTDFEAALLHEPLDVFLGRV